MHFLNEITFYLLLQPIANWVITMMAKPMKTLELHNPMI